MGRVAFCPPRPIQPGEAVEGFSCGLEIVDNWFHRRALGARDAGTAAVYVTVHESGLVAGFYTLSAHSVARVEVGGGWLARNAPEQVPAVLLGMMGVDARFQGMGLGTDLLTDAVRRADEVSRVIGARALVVDPAGEAARTFYAWHGFKPFGSAGRMFAKLV